MQIHNLVVARYLDGRVLKGVINDFSPNRPSFHVVADGSGEVVELRLRQLKALFFVRSFEGDPARQDVKGFVESPPETSQGRKIAVRFRDGEFLCGYTLSWSPDREGFFLFPADLGSNNQRVYVVANACDEIKAGPQAEALANRVCADEIARGVARPSPATNPLPPGTPGPSRVSAPMLRPSALGPRPSGILPSAPSTIGPRPSTLRPRPRTDAA